MSSKDSGHSSSRELQVPSHPLPQAPHPLPRISHTVQTPGSQVTEDLLCRNPVSEKSHPLAPQSHAYYVIPLNYRPGGEAHGQAVYTLLAALGASQVSVTSNLEATLLEGQTEGRGHKDTYSTKTRGARGARRARGARVSRGPRLSISATRSRSTLGRKRKRPQ